ncbi:MAG: MauE/DoxX family redox-associated membrane protein, partial [Bdellovibrionota bacterium]
TTYKPLILVAAFIIGVTALVEVRAGHVVPMRAMDNFMAGFFIFFSFFKFLNLKAFAEAFSTYDIIAKRSTTYALAYPFIELALGIMFNLSLFSTAANLITVVLMIVGNYGVWLVLKRKGTIECACLGTIFKLPMTKITLFENTLMLAMAAASLAIH